MNINDNKNQRSKQRKAKAFLLFKEKHLAQQNQ